ncbi:MAG TPA: phosphoribosylaminoimidazolesuccinocarboxamide synthase [Actinobacteria bacterium]|nr:phosphoribosylaminoimidazolesuccinocarboxamide synthase [Actinomycetota bacterium]
MLPDGYELVYSGKVRDLWSTPGGELLFVATDRISAYDYILPTRIPDKGKILTAVSLWWFDRLADLVPNHVVSLEVPRAVLGRAMVCRRLDMLPVECVARGYLTGSGLADYTRTGAVCGVQLPAGLVDGARLPDPIFTPATKAAIGDHDENIDFATVEATVGAATAGELRRLTLAVYTRAEGLARSRGLILADTKFEFGRAVDEFDQLVLADEVLTPDSSRWWPVESYEPGKPQPSFDKQFVRDWLTSPASGWDKSSGEQPPELPEEIVERTRAKYIEAYERLTGRTWS